MPYRFQNASGDDARVDDDEVKFPTLKANMLRLMAGRSIDAVRQQMGEAGHPIGTGTLHNALQGRAGNRIESLEKIAKFFNVTTAQLLQEDLGSAIDVWPFSAELREEISKLDPQQLHFVEKAMWNQMQKEPPATAIGVEAKQQATLKGYGPRTPMGYAVSNEAAAEKEQLARIRATAPVPAPGESNAQRKANRRAKRS